MGTTHEPERTCVGCRGKAPKGSLLRIARSPGGAMEVDRSGRGDGRGAYVHPNAACVDAAFRRGALVRALLAGADPDAATRLRRDVEEELRA